MIYARIFEYDYAKGLGEVSARNEWKDGPATMAPLKVSLSKDLNIAELETSKKKHIF